MAKSKVNGGCDSEKAVEADAFREEGSLVVFHNEAGEQVFAMPTTRIHTIERSSE